MKQKLETMDAETLMTTPLEQLKFIVEGLIPQGLHILAGSPKIGKSWLSLWICLQVAKGEKVWGFETLESDVLYLCLEDSFARIQSRLFEITDEAPSNLHFAIMSDTIGNGLEMQIENFLKEHSETRLIVIDTLQKIRSNRRKSQQKTVKPPDNLTPKQQEKWLNEQAMIFKKQIKSEPIAINSNITMAQYIDIFKNEISPVKHAKSTQSRNKREYERILPYLGHIKLKDLKAEDFRNFYAEMRKMKSKLSGEPLAEASIEGLHSVVCSILSSAMEQGYLTHNPAWRTYKPQGQKKEKVIADEETVQKILSALEQESIKYEVYFKIIIATGMRRGECCGIQWSDINFKEKSIHIQRNVVKVGGEKVFAKEPKTKSGNRYVYFSDTLASLLQEYKRFCSEHMRVYENKQMTDGTYLFKQMGSDLPMIPDTFSSRFHKILKDNNLPTSLNVHSLRHTTASLLIANGTDVATVASLLGHAQVSTTLDIYTHAFDKNRKKAAEELQKGLGV